MELKNFLSAKEAHKQTDEVLGLIYSNSLEKIFKAIEIAIDEGIYSTSIEIKDLRWFDVIKYRNTFKETMNELGYKLMTSSDNSAIIIDWF